jgi:predicted anti-sigma-YlaC factor YlaD
MTATTFVPSAPPVAIPLGEVLPWAIFAGLMLMIAIYFVGAEEGATSLIKGMYVHEFLHDGRHLLGFPCHYILIGRHGPLIEFGIAAPFAPQFLQEEVH